MKGLSLITGAAVAFTCSIHLFAQSQSNQSPVLPGDREVRVKHGKTTVRDKSKLVRKAIEDWYARNMEAFKGKDVAAIMALRTTSPWYVPPYQLACLLCHRA